MPKFYEPEELAHLQNLELEMLKDFIEVCEEHNLTYFGFAGTGIGALRHQGFIPWDDDIDLSLPRKDFEELLRIFKEEKSDKYYVLNQDTYDTYPLGTTRLCLKGTTFIEEAVKELDYPFGIFLDLYALDNAADGWIPYHFQMLRAWFIGKLAILNEIPRPNAHVHGVVGKIVLTGCVAFHHIMKFFHVSTKKLIRKREKANQKYNNKDTKRIAYFCDPLPHTNTFSKEDIYPLRPLPYAGMTLMFPNHLEKLLTKMYGDYMQVPPVEKRQTHYPYKMDFGPYKMTDK